MDIFKNVSIAKASGQPSSGCRSESLGLGREGRQAAAHAPWGGKTGNKEKQGKLL